MGTSELHVPSATRHLSNLTSLTDSCSLRTFSGVGTPLRTPSSHQVVDHTANQPNTYHIDPVRVFSVCEARCVMKEVIDQMFSGVPYDADEIKETARNAADHIKDCLKQMGYHRYKFVVTIQVVQNSNQGVRFTSMSLMDRTCDNFAEYSFSSLGYSIIGVVHAVYFN